MSLIAQDFVHFCEYLSVILDSSVESSLLRSLPHLFYCIICSFDDPFLELFVYFRDDVGLVKIFFHSVGFCFFLLTASFVL